MKLDDGAIDIDMALDFVLTDFEQPSIEITGIPESDPGPGHRRRILVADDHAIFRQCLIQLLEEIPELEVVADAPDGEQAVELAVLLHPDIVIMDVEMPRMNGIEATRKIKSILPGIRIIAVSMHPHGDVSAQILGAGAVQYFPKSDPVEELLNAIQS